MVDHEVHHSVDGVVLTKNDLQGIHTFGFKANPSGARSIEFPFMGTEHFINGRRDYDEILKRKAHPESATHPYEHRILGKLFIPRADPVEYASRVRELIKVVKPILQQGKSIPNVALMNLWMLPPDKIKAIATTDTRPNSLQVDDLISIGAHMTGFGWQAYVKGDLDGAILAWEASGGLRNPKIQEKLAEYAHRHNISLVDALARLGVNDRESVEKNSSTDLKPRPKTKILHGNPPELRSSALYNTNPDNQLFQLSHTGTSPVYIVGGPDGRSIVKLARMSAEDAIHFEIKHLLQAKGAGGLPQLEVILNNGTGYQAERIFGTPLAKVLSSELGPDKFGLSNRLWFIHDLMDAYKATGAIHGDLVSIEKNGQELEFGGNAENMILEDGTNRLRLIDYGTVKDAYFGSNVAQARRELKAAIELMFMGRISKSRANAPKALPTSPEIASVGQKLFYAFDSIPEILLDQKLQGSDVFQNVIPTEAKLPE